MDKIRIERNQNKEGYSRCANISLKRDDEKELNIYLGSNFELHFALNNFANDPTFYIGIDNYELYQIFDTLYNDIMTGNVGDDDDFDIPFSSLIFDEEENLRRKEIRKKEYRSRALNVAHNTGLIDGESIVWTSIDYPEEIAPYFKIDKLDNAYRISFLIDTAERPLIRCEKEAIASYNDGHTTVKIRNEGYCYCMFTGAFIKAYKALLEMELDEPQIHIAEYLLDKELESGKSLEHILTLKKGD